jgi:hypothetical protein
MKQFRVAFDTILILLVFAVIAYGVYATLVALSVGIFGAAH